MTNTDEDPSLDPDRQEQIRQKIKEFIEGKQSKRFKLRKLDLPGTYYQYTNDLHELQERGEIVPVGKTGGSTSYHYLGDEDSERTGDDGLP